MLEDMRLGILIKAGRLVRPGKTDQPLADIYIEGGRISRIAAGMVPAAGDQVIHAQGKMVLPGLVDLHVHMRDPGQTRKSLTCPHRLPAPHLLILRLANRP